VLALQAHEGLVGTDHVSQQLPLFCHQPVAWKRAVQRQPRQPRGCARLARLACRDCCAGNHHARSVLRCHPITHLLMSSAIFMQLLQPSWPGCVCADDVPWSCCCCLLPEGGRPLAAVQEPPPDTLEAKKGLSYRIVASGLISQCLPPKRESK
jgi:hypothetical protein